MKKKFNDIKDKYDSVYLFKRDINGNIIYWKAEVHPTIFKIAYYHGRIHSRFTSDSVKSYSEKIQGVNVGKSNETSNLEQCYSILNTDYNNHIKKGYKEYKTNANYSVEFLENVVSKVNTDANDMAKPMKAQPFKQNKFKYPAIGQPKYNGVRCICFKNTFSTDLFDNSPIRFLSKEGKDYNIAHLNKACYDILTTLEALGIKNPILDGELYIPGCPVTTIAGSAKNPSNPKHKHLQFVIFDLSIENYSQKERLSIIDKCRDYINIQYHHNTYSNPTAYITKGYEIKNDEQAFKLLNWCLEQKYEGAILRELETEYCFGQRPKTMMKLKRFEDSEFEILQVIEYGDRNQKVGYGCKFVCKNDINGLLFEVTVGGNDGTNKTTFTHEDKIRIVDNAENIIGKKCTAKFYERTINDLPFNANAIAIRDYE